MNSQYNDENTPFGLSLLRAFGRYSAVTSTIRVATIVSIARTPPTEEVIYLSISGSNILEEAIPYITRAILLPISRHEITASGFFMKRSITIAYRLPCLRSSSTLSLFPERKAIS